MLKFGMQEERAEEDTALPLVGTYMPGSEATPNTPSINDQVYSIELKKSTSSKAPQGQGEEHHWDQEIHEPSKYKETAENGKDADGDSQNLKNGVIQEHRDGGCYHKSQK